MPKDIATTYTWHNIAAANGNESGKYLKDTITKKMTPEQINKAEELAKEMVKKNPKLIKN